MELLPLTDPVGPVSLPTGLSTKTETVALKLVEATESDSADRLAELMTDDHTFIDSDTPEYSGREEMRVRAAAAL